MVNWSLYFVLKDGDKKEMHLGKHLSTWTSKHHRPWSDWQVGGEVI